MSTQSGTTAKVTNKDVRDTLHSVIESLIDGQEGFQTIGEHLKDERSDVTLQLSPSNELRSAVS